MRLKALLILPIISLIGLSLSLQFLCSLLLQIVVKRLGTGKSATSGDQSEEDNTVMWKCRKCQKPVYFAERKCSLGYDWHPECLTCHECGKRLNPGQHAEHKSIPYCYIPCYGALFGPQLYGHGSRVESHSSFGQKSRLDSDPMSEKFLENKVKEYNQYFDGKGNNIQYRERNGKLILEGSVRIYWDVSNVIQLKEDNDDRVFIRRQSYYNTRKSSAKSSLDDSPSVSSTSTSPESSKQSSPTSDCSSSVDSPDHTVRQYRTLPLRGSESAKMLKEELRRTSKSFDDEYVQQIFDAKDKQNSAKDLETTNTNDEVVLRRTCNLRRSRARLRRRCSINGHFYNRETSHFTPAHGSITSVFISSLLNAPEVINMLLDKFKVTNKAEDFSLFVLRDNGECRRLHDNEFPLIVRVMLGPNESAAKVFIFNKNKNEISSEVAQYLCLTNAELQMFLKKFEEEEIREINKIKKKFLSIKTWIKLRIKEIEENT
ncbi:ras association domain-containing protein 2-like [Oppia nitens]|uniref:ras association domain-containing protein 2-like n=1 Tax=Oppia nitens TaxID=1686743 RepID=UPI0023D985F5|nr:ras association domain-containing protein 2-like [Oppia nitens]